MAFLTEVIEVFQSGQKGKGCLGVLGFTVRDEDGMVAQRQYPGKYSSF